MSRPRRGSQRTVDRPTKWEPELVARADVVGDQRVVGFSVIANTALRFYLDCMEEGELTAAYDLPGMWTMHWEPCPACERVLRLHCTASGDKVIPEHPGVRREGPDTMTGSECPLSGRLVARTEALVGCVAVRFLDGTTRAQRIKRAIRERADRESLWNMHMADVDIDTLAEEIAQALSGRARQ